MYRYIIGLLLAFSPLVTWAAETDDNHFGFLGAGLDKHNFAYLRQVGAGWMRPHPGPAVWEMIQSEPNGEYDWDFMDGVVEKAQNSNIKLLITIWPFAAWDQVRKDDAARCEVSDQDQFLPNKEAEDKGRTEYLPAYRCNPYDWADYQRWVKAMVERYDGDGTNDMPELISPITHWEVMNEPDLPGSDNLDFYKDGMDEYYILLKRTARAIRRADKTAQIVIAGAAGGATDQPGNFLDFYRNLFSTYPKAKRYFSIGNIHHISPEGDGDFNVTAYRTLLEEFNINKPIWVTEAGAEGVPDVATQKSYIKSNTREAMTAGADKIFYIHYTFGSNYSTGAERRAKKVYKKLIAKWNKAL